MNKKVALNIINSILENGNHLYKLRLSNINLNDDTIFKNLIECLNFYASELTCLNLSNSCLQPNQLLGIAKVLKRNPQSLKTLDLSYNTLNKKN